MRNPLVYEVDTVLLADDAIDHDASITKFRDGLTEEQKAELQSKADALVTQSEEDPAEALRKVIAQRWYKLWDSTRDESLLSLHEGKTMARVRIRVLDATWMAKRIDGNAAAQIQEKAAMAVRAGVVSITVDGKVIEPDKHKSEMDGLQRVQSPEWVSRVRDALGSALLYEAGITVLNLSRLPVSARPTCSSLSG